MSESQSQTTPTVLMVRPHRFIFNEETMLSNAFQRQSESSEQEELIKKATAEFDNFVELLRENEVEVIVKQDTPSPPKPDAIFPNNWVMFHHNGDVSLFPMEAKNRRQERRMDIIKDLGEEFNIGRIRDFSQGEESEKYLEGTGSMIFDHPNRIAYACISTRTDKGLFLKYCQDMDYEAQTFHASDENGKAIYHTNVIMSVGKQLVVLCTESIKDAKERKRIADRIRQTGHELVEIDLEQMRKFAGNMLQVKNRKGEELMVMSSRAFASLSNSQLGIITKYTRIVHAPLTNIEDIGGGSARCMIAEIFAPKKV